jgi:hypothetical protein
MTCLQIPAIFAHSDNQKLCCLLPCADAAAARRLLQTTNQSAAEWSISKQSVLADTSKLERIIRNSKYRGTPAELSAQLKREKDLVSAWWMYE